MTDYTIGVKEFSDIIGADRADVSRAVAKGLIRAMPGKGGNSRGPGTKILDLRDAKIIAAAVRCGIPWQVAARRLENFLPFDGGIVVLEGRGCAPRRRQSRSDTNAPTEPQRIHQA